MGYIYIVLLSVLRRCSASWRELRGGVKSQLEITTSWLASVTLQLSTSKYSIFNEANKRNNNNNNNNMYFSYCPVACNKDQSNAFRSRWNLPFQSRKEPVELLELIKNAAEEPGKMWIIQAPELYLVPTRRCRELSRVIYAVFQSSRILKS